MWAHVTSAEIQKHISNIFVKHHDSWLQFSSNFEHCFCQIRPCFYEATLHVPLSTVLQSGTLCAENVPIGVLEVRWSCGECVGMCELSPLRHVKTHSHAIYSINSINVKTPHIFFQVCRVNLWGSFPSSCHQSVLSGLVLFGFCRFVIKPLHLYVLCFREPLEVQDLLYLVSLPSSQPFASPCQSYYPGESRQYSCLMKTKAKDAMCNKHRSDLKKRSHVEFLFLHSFVTSWPSFFPKVWVVAKYGRLRLCEVEIFTEPLPTVTQVGGSRGQGKMTKVSSVENRWRNFSLWRGESPFGWAFSLHVVQCCNWPTQTADMLGAPWIWGCLNQNLSRSPSTMVPLAMSLSVLFAVPTTYPLNSQTKLGKRWTHRNCLEISWITPAKHLFSY